MVRIYKGFATSWTQTAGTTNDLASKIDTLVRHTIDPIYRLT